MELAEKLLNPLVAGYLAVVVLTQWLLQKSKRVRAARLEEDRLAAGLTRQVLVDHSVQLAEFRRTALLDAVVLCLVIVLLPVLLVTVDIGKSEWREGLALTFAAMFVWLLVTATDVAKSFLGGLTFRLFASVKPPFQVGDRVTLKGHSGKVTQIGSFYVWLQTSDDDQVCIPTGQLWSDALVTANAGERSSLCVMEFFLAPHAGGARRQGAEDAIWDAIQASSYFDPAHPIKIFSEQTPSAIRLIAKAYVANTYKELDFKSEVTSQVLERLEREDIPLAGCIDLEEAIIGSSGGGDDDSAPA